MGYDDPIDLPWKQKRFLREKRKDVNEFALQTQQTRSRNRTYAQALKKKASPAKKQSKPSKKSNKRSRKPAKRKDNGYSQPRRRQNIQEHPRPDSGFYVEMRDILDQFRQELTELRTFRETLEDLTSRVARIEQKLGLTANGMDIEGPSLQDIVENIADHARYLEEKVDPDNGTEETFVDDNIVVQN